MKLLCTTAFTICLLLCSAQETSICFDEQKKLYGFCKDGKTVVDYQYTDYVLFGLVPDRIFVMKGDKYGIVDTSGKVIVPPNYFNGHFMHVLNWDGDLYADPSNSFELINDEGLMAVYNVTGECLFDFKYKNISALKFNCNNEENYRILVKENESEYTLRTRDDELLSELYFNEPLGYWYQTNTYVVLKDEKIFFINLCTGKTGNSFSPSDENRFEDLQYKGKTGLVSCEGKIVLPFEFTQMYYYGGTDPTFITYHENGQGIADTNGVEIIPSVYDFVERYCSNEIGNDIGHPFLAKKGDYYALLLYDEKLKKFVEKTDFIFKRLECRFDIDTYEYINHLETKEGKKGILNKDGAIKWLK